MIYVGFGGAIGAMTRYLISLIPWRGSFPILTLLTNLAGAFFIGFIVGVAEKKNLPSSIILFLKTGFCGGFTTFSTFSLETYGLLEKGNYVMAGCYMILSMVFCLAGVVGGIYLAREINIF